MKASNDSTSTWKLTMLTHKVHFFLNINFTVLRPLKNS